MCTVTIVPLSAAEGATEAPPGGRVRMACNRDELRTRPHARPPEIRTYGSRRVLMPVDPVSGGTWIAVNDAGLAAALLNANPEPGDSKRPIEGRASRGAILPQLMRCATRSEAAQRMLSIDAAWYAPFRLVLVADHSVLEFRGDGESLWQGEATRIDGPVLFTSSGLGDSLVEGPRMALFSQHFRAARDLGAAQDEFHRHAWPDRRPLSVCMERDDARTVSYCVVEIEPRRVRMTYSPDSPDRAVPGSTLAHERAEVCA